MSLDQWRCSNGFFNEVQTVSDASRLRIAGLATATAVGLGVLLVIAEFLNGPAQPTEGLFGRMTLHQPWAERAFIFLFGAVHLAVAVILGALRRTAV